MRVSRAQSIGLRLVTKGILDECRVLLVQVASIRVVGPSRARRSAYALAERDPPARDCRISRDAPSGATKFASGSPLGSRHVTTKNRPRDVHVSPAILTLMWTRPRKAKAMLSALVDEADPPRSCSDRPPPAGSPRSLCPPIILSSATPTGTRCGTRHGRAVVTEYVRALDRLPHEIATAVVETVNCADPGAAFDELDAKINAGMKAYAIPGVAVAVWAGGQEYVKGYGVTNVDHPMPVDGDTVFRIGSTTKTFTGTVMMRLVERGKVDLDSPVRRYIPDFAVADESASATVTVRQLLNHTAGWDGRNGQDFGRGDDAVALYVKAMTRLPQLTLREPRSRTTIQVLWLRAASSSLSPEQPTNLRFRGCCLTRCSLLTRATFPTK